MISIDDPWVLLRPLRSTDYDVLFNMEVAWSAGAGWRFGGRTPSYNEYMGSLYADSIVTAGVYRPDRSLLGAVFAYEPDYRNGTVAIAALSVDDAKGSGLVLVGMCQLITDLLYNWPFRIVLAESSGPAYKQFSSGSHRSFVEQGRLLDHKLIDGELHDVVYLAIEREAWMAAEGKRYLRRRQRAADAGRQRGGPGQVIVVGHG